MCQPFLTHEKINFNSEEVLRPIFVKSLGFHLNSNEVFVEDFKKDFIEFKQKGQRRKDSLLENKLIELSLLRKSIIYNEKDRFMNLKKYAIELFSWARHYAFNDPLVADYVDRLLNIAENKSLPQRTRDQVNDLIKDFLSKIPADTRKKKSTPINDMKLKIEYDKHMMECIKDGFKQSDKRGKMELLRKYFPRLTGDEIDQVSSEDNLRDAIASALIFKHDLDIAVDSVLQRIAKGSTRVKAHKKQDISPFLDSYPSIRTS